MTTASPLHLTVTRRFEAPPERVFDAWLDPDAARTWLFMVPDSKAVRAEIDPCVGGAFCFVDRRGDEDVTHRGTFLEIDRPRRLRFRFWVGDLPEAVDEADIAFAADGPGCTLTLTHALHPDWAGYQDFTRRVWDAMFDLLATRLAS